MASGAKNPFPGMNPYLEARWGDVHTGLCAAIRSSLQPNLPAGLRARAEERVLLSVEDEPYRIRRGDTVLIESNHASHPGGGGNGGLATVAPVIVEVAHDPIVHRWVKIVDARAGDRVVTIIEVLSPWNKERGRANKEYLDKVDEYLSSDVNFVEIDLLRSSRNRLVVSRDVVPAGRRADYLVCINRPARRTKWELYPIALREPLPVIPIPCRQTDPDVALALQPLIDRIYVEGGHDDINYSKAPEPPLSPDDQAWASGLHATDA